MKRISCIVILIWIAWNSNIHPQHQKLKFNHLTIHDGLSQNTISSISQDSKGFIWFGTWDGLNRYDGFNFKIFKTIANDTNSISNNAVTDILPDTLNNKEYLWVATQSGLNLLDLTTYSFTVFRNVNSKNSISSNFINVLLKDCDGNLWIGTNGGGLNKYNRKTKRFSQYININGDEFSLVNNTILSLAEDKHGNIWVGTSRGLSIFIKSKDIFHTLIYDSSDIKKISNNSINVIYKDKEDNMWLGTDSGLYLYNEHSKDFFRYKAEFSKSGIYRSNSITKIFEDSKSHIWIGTDGGGLVYFNKMNGKFYVHKSEIDNPESINDNRIASLFEDRSGVLWVGTWVGGLNYYDIKMKKFDLFRNDPKNKESLSSNSVYSIIEDAGGILWVGTADGLNQFDFKSKKFIIYRNEPANSNSLSSSRVWKIYEDPQNTSKVLWIGTNKGLNKFDRVTKKFTRYMHDPNDPNSISSNRIFGILKDSKKYFWVVTDGGGVNLFDERTGRFTRLMNNPNDPYSLSSNNVYYIFEDNESTIWIGTSRGLNKFNRATNKFECYKNIHGNTKSLSDNFIYTINQDKKNRLWVGTYNGGLNYFDKTNNTFRHYTEKDGLPNNWIYGILFDKNGYLWMSTNNGIAKFDPEREVFTNYDVSDGLQSNEFNNAFYQNSKGEMYFGGINGFNYFDPEKIIVNNFRPPVVITDLQLFNKSVPIKKGINGNIILDKSISDTKSIVLSYKDYVFSFEFAALYFLAPEKNKYAYIMEGFEKEWNFVGNRHFATYTNLPPGEYIFRVKAANKDNVWNEEGTSIAIKIVPPFYKTIWFIFSVIIFIIGCIIAAFQYRTKRFQIQKQLLELKVQERTCELKNVNDNLKTEIVEREKVENALRESEEKYRYLVENINDVIFSIIENDKVTYISPAIKSVLKYDPEEMIGQSFSKYFKDDDGQKMQSRFINLKESDSISNECRMIKKDDSICWMRISEKPTFINGKIVGVQGVLTDITERKMLETQLVQAQKLESIGQLAAGIAHEINTPAQYVSDNTRFFKNVMNDISSLLSKYDLLLIAFKNGEPINAIVEEIESYIKIIDLPYLKTEIPEAINQTLEGIERVSTIVRAMKDFSHPGNFDKSIVDLNKAIESTITISSSEWKYVAEIETDYDPTLPPVACYPGEFNQVILNMIINACHAITDVIKENEKGKIRITTKYNNNLVEIQIADTGTGMTEKIKQRIFDPFYTTKEVGKGTGQGLTLSRNIIVNKHNGTIDVDTEVGVGTTFTIKIPISAAN